jgi:hypothetical protein
MRPDLRKAEPAPKEGPEPNSQDGIKSSKIAPSHLKDDTSAVRMSGDGMTEEKEQKNGESKEEDEKEDGGNDKYYSAGSQDKPTLQSKSLEKNPPVLPDLPVRCDILRVGTQRLLIITRLAIHQHKIFNGY